MGTRLGLLLELSPGVNLCRDVALYLRVELKMDKAGIWCICLTRQLEKGRQNEEWMKRKRSCRMLFDCLPLALHFHSREDGIIYNPVHG